MLDSDLKLEWVLHPKLIFNNFNELFEALGEHFSKSHSNNTPFLCLKKWIL